MIANFAFFQYQLPAFKFDAVNKNSFKAKDVPIILINLIMFKLSYKEILIQ
jgi:uncharacterized protein with PQ loop repeat